jgi:hypothetical protein
VHNCGERQGSGGLHHVDNPRRRLPPTLTLDLLIWVVWTALIVLLMKGLWIASGATFCLWLALGCMKVQKVRQLQRQTLEGLETVQQSLEKLAAQARARKANEILKDTGEIPTTH